MVKNFFRSIVLFVLVSLAHNVSAQEETTNWSTNKVQISASVGTVSITEMGQAFGDLFSSALTDDKCTTDFSPSFSLQGMYNFNKKIGFGLIAGAQHSTSSSKRYGKESESMHIYVMPTVRINWINKRVVSLYSKAALGVKAAYTTYTDKSSGSNEEFYRPAFQISGIGVELGGKHLRGFAECGFGEQGLIQGGLRVGF